MKKKLKRFIPLVSNGKWQMYICTDAIIGLWQWEDKTETILHLSNGDRVTTYETMHSFIERMGDLNHG